MIIPKKNYASNTTLLMEFAQLRILKWDLKSRSITELRSQLFSTTSNFTAWLQKITMPVISLSTSKEKTWGLKWTVSPQLLADKSSLRTSVESLHLMTLLIWMWLACLTLLMEPRPMVLTLVRTISAWVEAATQSWKLSKLQEKDKVLPMVDTIWFPIICRFCTQEPS